MRVGKVGGRGGGGGGWGGGGCCGPSPQANKHSYKTNVFLTDSSNPTGVPLHLEPTETLDTNAKSKVTKEPSVHTRTRTHTTHTHAHATQHNTHAQHNTHTHNTHTHTHTHTHTLHPRQQTHRDVSRGSMGMKVNRKSQRPFGTEVNAAAVATLITKHCHQRFVAASQAVSSVTGQWRQVGYKTIK